MGGLFILLFEAPVRYIKSSFYQLLLTGYIVYQELQYFEICPDTAIGMTEILDTLLGYNSDTDIDLGGHEKNFHNGLSDCDNESLYMSTVPTLSEKSAIHAIVDENVVDHFPKSSSPRGRSHVCTDGGTARTYSCA